MFLADYYAQQLKQQNALSIEVISGSPVRHRLASGELRSSSAIGHEQVRQLVQEVAPSDGLDVLAETGRLVVDYAAIRLDVAVMDPQCWHVTIAPLRPDSEVQAAAQPARSKSAKDEMPSLASFRLEADEEEEPELPPPPPIALAASAPPTSTASPLTDPSYPDDEPRINRYLRRMIEVGASDLHMSSNAPALVRLDGEVRPLADHAPVGSGELAELLREIAPEDVWEEFEEDWDADFAHAIPGVARFRANYFQDRQGVGAVFRQIPFEILTPDTLGLPKEVLDLCWLSKGLVLVTGPTGSGKSTTLASLIDYINSYRSDHIITIEDPIEFVHENKRCLVNQREVGTHTKSFKKALRAALREDPDIVLVGELRDLETIAIAVETAETGHLVFGTLHTTTAPSTVDRIIDQFPAEQQGQIRTMLSESLKGVISQVLCKREGGGRAAAYEILLANAAIANLIREGKTHQLPSALQTGKDQGMRTMNDSLLTLVLDGVVDPREAYVKAVDKQGLRQMFQGKGIRLELDADAALENA